MAKLIRRLMVCLWCASCAPSASLVEAQRLGVLVDGLQQRLNRDEARLSELQERLLLLQHAPAPVAAAASMDLARVPPPYIPVSPQPPVRRQAQSSVVSFESQGRATELFHRALKAYQDGLASRAYDDFASFVRTYPRHPDADSALYWMGQCKFDAAAYRDAIDQYTLLANTYPQSSKAAEALFKSGLAYEKLQLNDKAHAMFTRLITAYPNTASAELARSREPAPEELHAP